jgi:hypothetical protein
MEVRLYLRHHGQFFHQSDALWFKENQEFTRRARDKVSPPVYPPQDMYRRVDTLRDPPAQPAATCKDTGWSSNCLLLILGQLQPGLDDASDLILVGSGDLECAAAKSTDSSAKVGDDGIFPKDDAL